MTVEEKASLQGVMWLPHTQVVAMTNLAEMIGFAQKRGIDVVLIGVPERKLFSDSAPLYGELATEYDVVFEEQMLANLLRKIEYKSDTVHLNQAGYRVMAEQLFSILIENGAL